MLVQLLYFPGCPHVEAARRALAEALIGLDRELQLIEVDVTAPDTPLELRSWGSPTVLIDGKDILGEAPSGRSCRLYPGSETPGVPTVALLRAALSRPDKPGSFDS